MALRKHSGDRGTKEQRKEIIIKKARRRREEEMRMREGKTEGEI